LKRGGGNAGCKTTAKVKKRPKNAPGQLQRDRGRVTQKKKA